MTTTIRSEHAASDSPIAADTVLDSIPTLALAVDCPSCAWRDFGATGLGGFVDEHPDRLDDTGRELIRQPLINAWRRRGYRVTLLCHHDCAADAQSADDPPAGIYIEVRQEAADEVPFGADFAAEAGLEAEYVVWGN